MQDEIENWPLLEAFRAARSGLTLEETTATREHRAGYRAATTLNPALFRPKPRPRKRRSRAKHTTKMTRGR